MSLDDRLRTGLARAAGVMAPDVEDRLQRTRTGFRRRRAARRATLATALVLLVGGVLVVTPQLIDHLSVGSPEPPGATRFSPAPSNPVLKGTWVTPQITRERIFEVLQDAGLSTSANAVISEFGIPTSWTLQFTDASFSVTSSTGAQVDAGVFSVSGTTLTMNPTCKENDQPVPCTITYSVAIDGDSLTFELVGDDSPSYLGTPDEAFQHAVYMAAPFSRT
jgi:hypothetical protein